MKAVLAVLVLVALIAAATGLRGRTPVPTALDPLRQRLAALAEPLPAPGPSDWLAQHREPGQTFAQYVRSDPVRPLGARSVLYVQPLGEFDTEQRRLVDLAASYLEVCFGAPVRVLDVLPPTVVPAAAQRVHPRWGGDQVLSTWVLHELLAPRLPEDAVALIAFTTSDLWPGEGWNFVFGQASLRARVGVWSLARFGDPAEGAASFRTALRRTLKTAVHETGHMFSIRHCTAWSCVMNGSNHLEESDRQPLVFCPECVAKVLWAGELEPRERFAALAALCAEEGLEAAAAALRARRAALDCAHGAS